MRTTRKFLAILIVPFLFLSVGPAQALGTGDPVMAEWPENRCWYHGVITEVRGAAFRVQFSDGDREWTTAAYICVRRNDL